MGQTTIKELCSARFSLFQNYYRDYLAKLQMGQIKKYEDIVKEIFMNGTFDYSSKQIYKQCLENKNINKIENDIEGVKGNKGNCPLFDWFLWIYLRH